MKEICYGEVGKFTVWMAREEQSPRVVWRGEFKAREFTCERERFLIVSTNFVIPCGGVCRQRLQG